MSERTNTKAIRDRGKYFLQAALCLLVLSATAFPQTSSWSLDSNHTHVEFQIRRVPVSNVRGSFGGIVGTLVWDEKDPSKSQVEVTISTANISTNNSSRDTDLKSANFFDVQKYPTMTFRSTAVTGSASKLQVVGNLTLAGVTRPVTLSVDAPTAATKMGDKTILGFEASGTIKRSDFNFASKYPTMILGDEIKFTIDVEADSHLL